jgi:ubiquinone/menaquinone biosynthesis C-methylase UbiE
MFRRWLAGQFARPSGWPGRYLVGRYLDRLSRGMNRLALEQLDVRPGDHVLEIGFGGGALLTALLDMGATTTGVDASEAMVERAGERFRRAIMADALKLHRANAESMPLADASVDRAVSVNSLYFWKPSAFAELGRVVRPRGRLVLCFQAPEAVRAWPGHVFGFGVFTEGEVIALMEEAGFAAVASERRVDPKLGAFFCLTGLRSAA